ncbi:lipocalin-like domain-containing protein [Xylanibacter ruminicola]|uniref:lipocalin-like domain-containing protein n=1 Tax=Xylanibacter ruminicola TaxID=839 RepID=UPI00048AF1B5|nr:glycoside hydrolase family 43 C-terminal domain-containing protein [Xylanibacter ruminicola]
MKKINLLLGVVSMLLCISCSSDDFEITTKNIIGHWQSVTYYGYSINLNTNERTDYEEKPYTSLSIKLYEDGACTKGSTNGTYKLLGKELDLFLSYYHSMLKKEISWTEHYTIDELSSDKMVLTNISHGTSGGSDPTYYEDRTTYTMKRIN